MKVSLKNVGMLDEADFEVGELTIICGENNTGKTYATYSLYGYLDFIKRNPNYMIFSFLQNAISENKDFINIVDDYIIKISLDDMIALIIDLLNALGKTYTHYLAEILAGKGEDFEIANFTIDSTNRISQIFYQDDSKEHKNIADFFSGFHQFQMYDAKQQYILFKCHINYQIDMTLTEEMEEYLYNDRKKTFCLNILDYVVDKIYPKAFILSAERTGVSMFQKELDVNKNEIVERISRADTKNIQQTVINVLNSNYSRYPRPVKDNIYFVRELDEVGKKTSFIKKEESLSLHKEIIELLYKVVGGKYIVREFGIEFAPGARQRITKGKFLIQRASSSVRSLLMLNYYILNVAQKGDILMIDEPELNLHPNSQILMGRLIALLVNAGVKVFITTHSDYIVRELSNCIMLNNLSNEQIDKLSKKGYAKEYKLEFNKVKAYLAQKNKGKNTLKQVKIDCKRGIFMDTFDEPINSQNENQSLIFEEIIRATNDK